MYFSKEIEDALEDIMLCIDKEEDGLFLWGADDDACDLFGATREDLITPEMKNTGLIFMKSIGSGRFYK